jgi:hypothetical protein
MGTALWELRYGNCVMGTSLWERFALLELRCDIIISISLVISNFAAKSFAELPIDLVSQVFLFAPFSLE